STEEARNIRPGRALYQQARRYIGEWTDQFQTIEDRPFLTQAERLAAGGDIASLLAAIEEARKIRPGRPLSDQASQSIRGWTHRIQRIQDQPFLSQAQVLASSGNLPAAIAAAERIRPGRVLYDQAQADIRGWRDQIQQREDRPLLARARALANTGNVSDAIAVANQIAPGRTLYDEAQAAIQSWQAQYQANQGQEIMTDAYRLAGRGTPGDLARAIERANQVATDSPSRSEADNMINTWGQGILELATAQAPANPEAAITIAQQVPAISSAHAQAQNLIQTWQQQLEARE
ncbi:MAG: chromosome segregation ATPase, partial [Cyanothece sp. SIO1E1]|nr:chromosome segregation ATPase [Cyanothece sp. SIO1E1]